MTKKTNKRLLLVWVAPTFEIVWVAPKLKSMD